MRSKRQYRKRGASPHSCHRTTVRSKRRHTTANGAETSPNHRRDQLQVSQTSLENERRRYEKLLLERQGVQDQQRRLLTLLESMHRAKSLPEIYEAAVDAVCESLKVRRASILLYDEKQVMRFKFSRGLSSAYRQAVEGHSPWKPDEIDPKPVFIEDIEATGIESGLREVILAEGIRALAFLPLTYEGRLLGKFMVYHEQPHGFTDEEMRIGQAIAAPVALAVERRQAADDLEAAKTQLEDHTKNLEQVIIDRTARLRDTINELEAFAYSLSHDMRAPLRAMRSFSEILRAQYSTQLGEKGNDLLDRIINAAGRLDALIQDVLAYTRITVGPISRVPVDLTKLVERIVQDHTGFQEPNARIEIVAPLDCVMGHEGSLTQCVYNLLSNAVKFVAEGTKPHVRIWSASCDSQVKVWFEDNGIGIPADVQDRMFLMFHRFHPNEKFEGTGIGLAIVRRAAERMGGKTGVESEPGKGSRFWLLLPALRAPNKAPAP